MNQIERIRQLIADDDLFQAISVLKALVKTNPILDSLLIQEGSLNDLEKKILNGTIDFKEASIKKNEIRESLLKIARILEAEAGKNEEINKILSEVSVGNKFDFAVSINDWIKTKRGARISITLLVMILAYFFLVAISLFPTGISHNDLTFAGILVQVLFTVFAAYCSRQYKEFDSTKGEKQIFADEKGYWRNLRLHRRSERPPENDEEDTDYRKRFKTGGNKSISQFVHFWFFLWAFWALMGLVLILQVYHDSQSIYFTYFKNLFNSLNTLMFIYLYVNITISTSKAAEAIWLIFGIGVGILSFIEPVYVQSLADKNNAEFWIQLTISLISSMALMAFFGRLSGKFMNVPYYLMLFLYAYVLYQLIYPILSCGTISLAITDKEGIEQPPFAKINVDEVLLYALFFSLIVKSILFGIITWLLDSGKMLYFIAEESSLNFKQDDDFRKFLFSVPLKDEKIFEK